MLKSMAVKIGHIHRSENMSKNGLNCAESIMEWIPLSIVQIYIGLLSFMICQISSG